MFEKFRQSWALMKASAGVLSADKELLVFPALSALCCVIVAATFFVPAAFAGLFEHFSRDHIDPVLALLGFLFYLVQYFVIIFFNTALVGAAMIRLRGGDPTVADGFRIAMAKLPAILGYALISATVGLLLRALQERAGFIGRWVVGLIGAAWAVATFLVVPVLVNDDVGPVDAVKRSVGLLKKTWGENLVGNAGIGVVFGLLAVAVILTGAVLIGVAASLHSTPLIVTAIALTVAGLVVMSLIQAALTGIYAAAIYRYAEDGEVGAGFDRALVANAFRVKA
ncbi:MAG: hypothetical protein BGP24_13740 [Lysobacterales bacterium 69-70]|nr:hypothetical protein [Xanthomonadaceae bacterium]ODU31228.1 MAG: hypothetical protein ABS97_23500 [Xanthomonadaceae bacterium SCN 69-320]ODV22711.1 MAG: hypothetical protein ABT27_01255 [Xanthomonadaceae bacterium SCN 69-25]OJY98817.1 MAG: hypothetical protein BGP24_13740 [Xanthomonadales bacterium 69-70]